jgi:hypothetical protein
VPAAAIRNADWHHEFVTPQVTIPAETSPKKGPPEETPSQESPDSSQSSSDVDPPAPDEVRISVGVLNEIRTILAHYREAGKREEQLAEPGSIPAARAQTRWYTAGRFIEFSDIFHGNTDDRPGHKPATIARDWPRTSTDPSITSDSSLDDGVLTLVCSLELKCEIVTDMSVYTLSSLGSAYLYPTHRIR